MFRSAFVHDPDRAAEVMELNEREAISDPRLLVKCGVVLVAVLVGFTLSAAAGYAPAVVALLGAGVLVLISGVPPRDYLADVEAPTLLFFAGLFVMVGALVHTGVIEALATVAAEATQGRLLLATMVLLWASALLSAVIDNIPYVATMSPIVAELVRAGGGDGQVLWWALAFGADLGGNATAVGAAANVVVIGIAARNRTPIGFWEFTRYGLVVTLAMVALVTPYLWLRYLV
jgi:Na+/H+ antiporter NhaD/arsenite permease-like protein